MELFEPLSAQLPPNRPDEPARLRQDILDELKDHLSCAYNREILRGASAAVARQRVLEKFGDPAAVARRLWLEAMRGKIMAQRMLIGTCVLVTAVSICLVGLLWQQAVLARRLAVAQAAEARAREQEVLARLEEMSALLQHPRSPDWNLVRLKLTEETPDGPPVVGATIALTRMFENPAKTIQKKSDASGLADFGSINPGDYTFNINRSTEDWTLQNHGELNVQPGSDVTKSVVCAKAPPPRAGVRLRWQWPDDLKDEPLCLFAPFKFRGLEVGPGNEWFIARRWDPTDVHGTRNTNRGNMGRPTYQPQHLFLCGPSTTISELLGSDGPFLWRLRRDGSEKQKKDAGEFLSGEWADFWDADIRELKDPTATTEMETGRYGLSRLLVLRPVQPQAVEPGQRRFKLLVAASAANSDWLVNHSLTLPNLKLLETMEGGNIPAVRPTFKLNLPRLFGPESKNHFEVRAGQTNEWAIPIPDELAQAVREALKAEKSPKAKPAENRASANGNG